MTPQAVLLERLLEDTDDPKPVPFAEFLQHVFESGYTGQVTIDFKHGKPRQFHLGAPVRIPIATDGT